MDFSKPPKKNSDAHEQPTNTEDSPIESFLESEDAKKQGGAAKNARVIIGAVAVGIIALVGLLLLTTRQAEAPDPDPTDPTPVEPVPPEQTGRPPVTAPGDREYADSIDRRVHDELVAFSQWVSDNNTYAIIGEFGWPNDQTDGGEQWRTVAENYLIDLAQTNMVGYYWATGGAWGGYTLAAHNAEDRVITSNNSQTFQLNAFSKDNALGINMAGLEFGTQLEDYSNENPGTVENDNYIFNGKENYDYIAAEGYSTVRVPFTWERLQPTLNGPLDPTYLGYIRSSVEFAEANDLHIILDLHNYGEYETPNGTLKLGSSELTHDMLVDVWLKLSSEFASSSADVSYGIMNEPRSLPASSYGSPAGNWEAASQQVVTSLREAGDESEIIIGGYNWSKLSTWEQYHDDAWINDPLMNTIYEAHHYWDSDTSGTYTNGYR